MLLIWVMPLVSSVLIELISNQSLDLQHQFILSHLASVQQNPHKHLIWIRVIEPFLELTHVSGRAHGGKPRLRTAIE